MKIIINFQNKKNIYEIKKYQSIYSIINEYLNMNNINDDIDNYYLDYNGKYLDKKMSLEKYKIKDNFTVTLNKKNKGGNSFFSFAKKYPYVIFIVFIIVLLPLFILPTGFVPTVSSLLHLIIQNSIETFNNNDSNNN